MDGERSNRGVFGDSTKTQSVSGMLGPILGLPSTLLKTMQAKTKKKTCEDSKVRRNIKK